MPRTNVALAIALLLFCGCPIAPDEAADAGTTDAGTTDGGTTDAGLASGNIAATLTTSNSTSQVSLAWLDLDLSQTTVDVEGSAGPSQVTLVGTNAASGTFSLTLTGLSAGSGTVTFYAVRYIPATGTDLWSCDTQSVACPAPQITLSDNDGGFIAGTFDVSFYGDSDGNTAQLYPGSFAVQLP